MTFDEIMALVTVGVVTMIAVWLNFRNDYTDLERHPPAQGNGSLELNLPRVERIEAKKLDDYWKAKSDGSSDFFANVERFFGKSIDFSFQVKIVGVNHANHDRTRRSSAVKRCVPLEILVLEPEPDNPEDPYAMAVKLQDSRIQLGYLEWFTARDIRRDMETGRLWFGLFKRFWCADSGTVIGAEILLVRLKPEAVEVKEAIEGGASKV